jgi:hypothetical protein
VLGVFGVVGTSTLELPESRIVTEFEVFCAFCVV